MLICNRRVFGEKTIPEDFWNADAHSKSIEMLMDGSPLRITLLVGLLRSKAEDEWPHVIDQLQYLPDDKPPTATYFEKQQQQQLRQEQRQEVKQQQQELQQGQKEPQKQQQQQQEGQLEKQQKQPEEQEEQLKKYKKQLEEQKQEREQLQIRIQQLLEKHQQQDQQHKKEKPNRPSIKHKQISLTEKILSLSFDSLPPYLKQCFLYFAAFKAEVDIDCDKLIRLWMAEGFVQTTEESTMEECGQVYLRKLASRCLIDMVEMDYSYKIVTISIHERVLAFARQEAQYTNFLQVHNRTTNIARTSIRRLSLQSTFDADTSLNFHVPKLRSLLCDFVQTTIDHSSRSPFSTTRNLWKKATEHYFTIYRCKFLRVIDLKGAAHFSNLPKDIGWLIHLRYLGLAGTSLTNLPNSVKNLCNLQTLDITETKIDAVPEEFWKIRALRHVLAQNLKRGPVEASALCNLQTLIGMPWPQNGAILNRLTNLQFLHVHNLSSGEDSEALLNALSGVESLTSLNLEGDHLPLHGLLATLILRHLQRLKLHGTTMAAPAPLMEEQHHGYLLPNLTKLELYKSGLCQAQINMISELPNLADLIIGEDSYLEEEMVISDGGFHELRKLQIKKLRDLKTCRVATKTPELPNLPELIIGFGEDSYCEQEMVISDGGSTLQQLERISIFSCTELTIIPVEHLQALQHLVFLKVNNCPKLGKLPEKTKFWSRRNLLIVQEEMYDKEMVHSSTKNKMASHYAWYTVLETGVYRWYGTEHESCIVIYLRP